MSKIIAFDIDDTLNRATEYEIELFMNYSDETKKHATIINYKSSNSSNRFVGVSKKIIDEFISYSFPKIVKNAPVEPKVAETIDLLRENEWKIYIITRRDENNDKYQYKGFQMKKDTLEWLEKNKIHYDKLIFSAFDKAETCKNSLVDIMVEDDPIQILQISSKASNVIVNKRGYNTHISGPRIHRIDSYDPESFLYLCENIINNKKNKY